MSIENAAILDQVVIEKNVWQVLWVLDWSHRSYIMGPRKRPTNTMATIRIWSWWLVITFLLRVAITIQVAGYGDRSVFRDKHDKRKKSFSRFFLSEIGVSVSAWKRARSLGWKVHLGVLAQEECASAPKSNSHASELPSWREAIYWK